MPRKEKTPEEKKAWGEKMRAAKEAKKYEEWKETASTAKAELQAAYVPQVEPSQVAPEVGQSDLQRQIDEIKATNQALLTLLTQQNQNTGPQATHRGLVGTFEKYVVDPANYADPKERLAGEARLSRFAFKENYFLDFEVGVTSYETKDGINTKEPKFMLKLNRYVVDEDTGELTGEAYTVCQLVFHEDPQAAIVVARENNIQVDESNQKAFLDEMRYLRMRDWLLECFYPPRPQASNTKRQLVIGNRVVEVFEVNSEEAQKIPFTPKV